MSEPRFLEDRGINTLMPLSSPSSARPETELERRGLKKKGQEKEWKRAIKPFLKKYLRT